jgi:YD repeat-containing protein
LNYSRSPKATHSNKLSKSSNNRDSTIPNEGDIHAISLFKDDPVEITPYDDSSRGELLAVILPNTTQIEYLHDPLGRRIAKKVNGAIVDK